MRVCTFTPAISSSKPSTAGATPVVVRGLGRYIELKMLAKQQAEEKRRTEERVFLLHPQARAACRSPPHARAPRVEMGRRLF